MIINENHPSDIKSLLLELSAILGADQVMTDEATRRLCSTDLYVEGKLCCAVIRPSDATRLAQSVGLIAGAGIAVIPRGGGLTYVSGYTPPAEQSVIIDVSGLDRIIEINETDMYVTVEAGVTWKTIYEALAPRGLRLPFFGTFSGAGATIGGGLSNGAMFLGSARYGSAAEIVLGLEVALSDGTLVRTGQAGIVNSAKPAYRTYGPDLTGLFVHDAGAFGVKTRATLRVIRTPREIDYLSFLLPTVEGAVETLSEIGRNDLTEEIYVVDPIVTRQRLEEGNLLADASLLRKVVTQERGLLRGLKSGFQLVAAGRHFLDQDHYSVHLVCAGRSRAAVEADVAECRRIALAAGGWAIPNSIPKATRAMAFADLSAILGTRGDRWIALNCKVAHSDAITLIRGTETIFAQHRPAMDAAGVTVTLLLSAISNHVFSYECVFRWLDSWLPLHKAAHPALNRFIEPQPNPAARAVIAQVRSAVVKYFFDIGAASAQIGRTYPYFEALAPSTRTLVESLKRIVDPFNKMNPGALGISWRHDSDQQC
ncbi:MAG: FAD-binding oxidoreductase [Betaproteobacteria bacterium]|nr:FAD-binding oxidoreductase [Betaproteobacteria bacterium]